MGACLTSAHWRAVLTLQAIRDRHEPGSFHHEIADHAIDLVISGTRPPDKFLVRNAYRDARSILIRRKKRWQGRELVSLDEDDSHSNGHVHASLATAEGESPEQQAIFVDAYNRLTSRLPQSNKFVRPCLERWRLGDSLDDTAAVLEISHEYVKKLRRKIRACAHETLAEFRRAA